VFKSTDGYLEYGNEVKSVSMTPTPPKADWVRKEALANEPLGVISHPYGLYHPLSFNTLWAYWRDSPEAIACVNVLVEDIMSCGWEIKGALRQIKRAEKYLIENDARNQIRSMLYDAFVTGNGYIYKKTPINENELKSRLERLLNAFEVKSTKSVAEELISEWKQEHEDILTDRKFRYLSSSTIRIDYDVHGDVHQYVQIVGSQWRWFTADDIIHFKLYDIDGQVYGYTPLQSILREVDTLANVKDLAKYYFEKGGVPNFMFNFPNETPNSATMQAVSKTLQEFAQLPNKYKSLILSGECVATPLNPLNKDMEYRDLARYMTQVIVNVFGVPASRLPGLLLDSGMKGNVSSEGYYRKIEHWQATIENLMNSQLMEGFNVVVKFKRTFREDDIRESQSAKVNADTAIELRKAGIVKDEYVWDMLKIPEDMRGTMEPKVMDSATEQQGLLNNHQMLTESTEKLQHDQKKQDVAMQKKSAPFEEFKRTGVVPEKV